MKAIISKNEILPSHLDPEHFGSIFWHIREHPEEPQSKRVGEVLELLSSLRDDLSTRGKGQVIARLRHVLSNYRWGVHVSPTSEGFRAIYFPADRGSFDKWEYEAVRDLLDLVPYLGKPPRVRRCAECKAWFFAAKKNDQQYCDGVCRQHRYDSSPEMRESKKLYMRKYREDEKKRKASQDRAAKREAEQGRTRKSLC